MAKLLPPFNIAISSYEYEPIDKTCSPRDVRKYQWASGFTSLHVPKYTVQIINEAWHVKGVFGVRISCGEFASKALINPMIFRRISFCNCLLKDGRIMNRGDRSSFVRVF